MMRPILYPAVKAAQLACVAAHQLGHWARIGFLVPSFETGKGKGSRRLYSERDVLAAQVVQALHRSGLHLKELQDLVLAIQRGEVDTAEPGTVGVLMPDGTYIQKHAPAVAELLGDEHAAHVVNIGRLRQDRMALIAEFELTNAPVGPAHPRAPAGSRDASKSDRKRPAKKARQARS